MPGPAPPPFSISQYASPHAATAAFLADVHNQVVSYRNLVASTGDPVIKAALGATLLEIEQNWRLVDLHSKGKL